MVYPDRFRKFMHRFVSNTWLKNSKLLHWFKIRLVCPLINLKWKFLKVKFFVWLMTSLWRHQFHNQLRFEITVFDWLMFNSQITLFLSDLRKNHILFGWIIYNESFIFVTGSLSPPPLSFMALESVNHVKLFTHLYIDEATRQKRPKSSSFHCEGNLGK